ncbi:MAG TPA: adenylate kinase [Gemmataceae bacterium]|nr:adenylate kinase [Gemmataceae bacterium]
MRLILLGPPGSGKGTQAALLCRRNGLEHIGTGDILRQAIANHTPTGEQARPFVETGKLVPDGLVNDIVAERFQRDDRPDKFVMDGYPRTEAQAASFDQVLRQQFLDLTAVVLLCVSDEAIVGRLAGRWSCPKAGCKATYHTQTNPPRVAGVCDDCGAQLVQRDDDRPETVRRRLVVYHKNTEKLIPHYAKQGLLRRVEGDGEIERVYQNIMKALQAQAGPAC